jgi:hypothetical protein
MLQQPSSWFYEKTYPWQKWPRNTLRNFAWGFSGFHLEDKVKVKEGALSQLKMNKYKTNKGESEVQF